MLRSAEMRPPPVHLHRSIVHRSSALPPQDDRSFIFSRPHRDTFQPSSSSSSSATSEDAAYSAMSRESQAQSGRSSPGELSARVASASKSSHNASTASYTWSRFEPFSSRDPTGVPVLYVDYRVRPPPFVRRGSSRASDGVSAARSAHPVQRKKISPTSSPYPSLSAVTSSSTSAHNLDSRTRPTYMGIRHPRAESRGSASDTRPRVSPSTEKELDSTFRGLEINMQSNGEDQHTRASPPWQPCSSESESSSSQSPVAQGSIYTSRNGTVEPEGEEWLRYARTSEGGGGSTAQFICVWSDARDGRAASCGYTSKKHLVKRHIESKHLQIKPITCEICGKGFSQRTNYHTHMNTHTGAAPHKCPHCDMSFGDPARRHRHMKTVHNHVPSKRKTQADSGSVTVDTEMSEDEDSS